MSEINGMPNPMYMQRRAHHAVDFIIPTADISLERAYQDLLIRLEQSEFDSEFDHQQLEHMHHHQHQHPNTNTIAGILAESLGPVTAWTLCSALLFLGFLLLIVPRVLNGRHGHGSTSSTTTIFGLDAPENFLDASSESDASEPEHTSTSASTPSEPGTSASTTSTHSGDSTRSTDPPLSRAEKKRRWRAAAGAKRKADRAEYRADKAQEQAQIEADAEAAVAWLEAEAEAEAKAEAAAALRDSEAPEERGRTMARKRDAVAWACSWVDVFR